MQVDARAYWLDTGEHHPGLVAEDVEGEALATLVMPRMAMMSCSDL